MKINKIKQAANEDQFRVLAMPAKSVKMASVSAMLSLGAVS